MDIDIDPLDNEYLVNEKTLKVSIESTHRYNRTNFWTQDSMINLSEIWSDLVASN
jgi:hypothetical protein